MKLESTKEIKRLLVIRFSAMGDVAMTEPVVTLLARQHPDLRITVVTRQTFVPLFEWVPSNVEVRGIDLNSYKGLLGLERLFSLLHRQDFDAVADLHDVLRTKYLHSRFRMTHARVAVIDKQRKQKRAFLGHALDHEPLRPMFERYADVFRSLGLSLTLDSSKPLFDLSKEDYIPIHQFAGRKAKGERWIGIAPFAAHSPKVYPLERMQEIANTCADYGYRVFLFGAGDKETAEMEMWETEGITSVCGRLGGLHNELLLISQLDLMLCMDSANMHLAAMLGIPTLSVWGATHPCAGFMAWGTTRENIVEIADLPCRPCSIYGSRPCKINDFRCMKDIQPEAIMQRIEAVLRH
ncbi:MAG: glycosyltransferase family 9 protein [Bacteroidaceae bacterium]|nr:glycosyltransferase family 9 protein [Bacteroidaceae bacterium]